MATYYVTADAGGGGSGSQISPWTIQEAFNLLLNGSGVYVAGDIIKIKAGTHTMSANVAAATSDVAGTIAAPITFIACDASWNPINVTRNASTKKLDYTSGVVINMSGYYLNTAGNPYVYFIGIKFEQSYNGPILTGLISYGGFYQCSFVNSNNGSSSSCISLYTGSVAIDCDFACTGTSSTYLVDLGNTASLIGCVLYSSKSYAVHVSGYYTVIDNCLIYGYATYGVYNSTTNTNQVRLYNSTIVGGTHCVYFSDTAYTLPSSIVNCILTGASTYAIYYSNATGCELHVVHNHIYNNANAISFSGSTIEYGTVTTNTSDFRASGSADYRLDILAPALNSGIMNNSIGALGPEDIPPTSSVLSTDTVMGETGTATAGEVGLVNNPFASNFFK